MEDFGFVTNVEKQNTEVFNTMILKMIKYIIMLVCQESPKVEKDLQLVH